MSVETRHAVGSEVRPEELTELVERLHRRQEHLSVGDVAETLGVSPEAVESTLRAMRSERVPPIAAKQTTIRGRKVRSRRGVAFALAGCFVIGGWILTANREHDRGLREGFAWALSGKSPVAGEVVAERSGEDLADDLRKALPAGMSVAIGKVTYTGSVGGEYADEAELTEVIRRLIDREVRDVATSSAYLPEARAEGLRGILRQGGIPGDQIFETVTIRVSGDGAKQSFDVPRYDGMERVPPFLSKAIGEYRTNVARTAANQISEWAEARKRAR